MCIARSPGSGVTVLFPLIENATTHIQLHVYLLILCSRTKYNQLVGLFYLMLTFGYSEV